MTGTRQAVYQGLTPSPALPHKGEGAGKLNGATQPLEPEAD
jgi:hypothetical protein